MNIPMRIPLWLTALLLVPGCQIGYIWKQGLRQLEISRRQVPLTSDEVKRSLSEEEREKLRWIPPLLDFAREDLGLDPDDCYTTYLDTGGKPVSHVLVAAHPEALLAHEWCFPFVGCVPYKGYFDEEDAREEAARLRAENWDVAVLPVGAYSSLGWFRDPVLSTMLALEVPEIVELLLHEIVHRTLYVQDAATFNESLATHIAREGAWRFFARHPDAATEKELEDYRELIARSARDEELLRRLRWDLETLYRSSLARGEKLRRKEEIFATARRARSLLHGFETGLPASNAWLLAAMRYHELLPTLEGLQARTGGHPRDLMAYLKGSFEKTGRLPEELSPSS